MAGSRIQIFKVSDEKIIDSFNFPKCTDSAWINRNQIICTSLDKQVKIFDLNTHQTFATFKFDSQLTSIASTNQPRVFVIGTSDGYVQVLDINSPENISKIAVHQNSLITSVKYNSFTNSILSIGKNNEFVETHFTNYKKVNSFSCSTFVIHDEYTKLSVHPFGHFTCSGSNNGKVFLFPVDQGSVVELDHQHQSPVICSAFCE